jgi:D-alanyl-D-alanine carboxypeptidase/D-alanyl-D-alanine-endopeptidase (penicillin-binding protein 4)
MNLYAEALCKRLGFAATNEPGTWLSGTAAMGEFLKSCGVTEDQFRLDDGCGLSKENAISAEAIVRVLAREFGGKNRRMFLDSLSVSGADGTLKDRFADTTLRGRVFAKSGYVNYVGTLSGYVNTTDGDWYAFSILMNEVPFRTNNRAKELQERIVDAIEASAKK